MKTIRLASVVIALLLCGFQASFAAYISECIIYPGPPDYGEVYSYANQPTSASGAPYGRDIQVYGDWWDLGGRLTANWDKTSTAWLYGAVNMDKSFTVTAAGPAAISFLWSGSFQVSGNAAYDDLYSVWAAVDITDSTNPSSATYFYDELTQTGSLAVSRTQTYEYFFDAADIGKNILLSFEFQIEATPNSATALLLTDQNTLNLSANFMNGLQISDLSGGLIQNDGPTAVPVPGTFWLVATGLLPIWVFGRHRKQESTVPKKG